MEQPTRAIMAPMFRTKLRHTNSSQDCRSIYGSVKRLVNSIFAHLLHRQKIEESVPNDMAWAINSAGSRCAHRPLSTIKADRCVTTECQNHYLRNYPKCPLNSAACWPPMKNRGSPNHLVRVRRRHQANLRESQIQAPNFLS